ncbi:hypothetical protein D3C81_2117690 [compost metagenome]
MEAIPSRLTSTWLARVFRSTSPSIKARNPALQSLTLLSNSPARRATTLESSSTLLALCVSLLARSAILCTECSVLCDVVAMPLNTAEA